MNLSGLFQYGNKNSGRQRTEAVKPSANISASDSSRSKQAVRNLTRGQTLQGEIISKNGREVQIRIDRDIVITARLDNNMNVSVGQNMTFEVKNNSDMQIALRPLYENLAQDANILKALEAAKLPATDELMRMVSSMMEQGMSIDKNTLQDMGRLIMANPDTAPETIVALRNMQLPITPENIEQYERYQNYEHQIVNTVTDILSELPEAFLMMTAGGQTDAAIDFYSQILQLFSGSPASGQGIEGQQQGAEAHLVFSDLISDADSVPVKGNVPEENVAAGKETIVIQDTEQPEPNLSRILLNPLEIESAETGKAQPDAGRDISRNPLLLSGSLNEGERSQLLTLLGKLGFSEEQLLQIQNGSLEVKQLLQDIHHMLSANGESISKESVVNLFGSKVYNQLLNNEILQQWLLKPGEVSKKDNVEAFYGRLREQSARMTEALSQAVKDTPLAKSLTVMQNNIDFMNQLNQVFNYVQLPLKMSGGNAHGELYVYTNRKSSFKEDGSVSALLHLDMENLGTMDVHVAMQEKNVSTRFYLKDESIIDFMAENIHILNERLTKRGYSMKAEMVVSEAKSTNPIQNMSAEEKKESILSHYSFDVRA